MEREPSYNLDYMWAAPHEPLFNMIVEELHHQAQEPPSGDPVLGALFKAILKQPRSSPLASTLREEVAQFRLQGENPFKRGSESPNTESTVSEVVGAIRASICT